MNDTSKKNPQLAKYPQGISETFLTQLVSEAIAKAKIKVGKEQQDNLLVQSGLKQLKKPDIKDT